MTTLEGTHKAVVPMLHWP